MCNAVKQPKVDIFSHYVCSVSFTVSTYFSFLDIFCSLTIRLTGSS